MGRNLLICVAMVLFLPACAHAPQHGPVAKLPYCRGTWVSVDAGETYTCLSPEKFQQWRQRNGL